MILLDTHVLIWMDAGSSRLGSKALQAIDMALGEEELLVSAISFWEVSMLCAKGRLRIDQDLVQWRAELLAGGLREIPITGGVGIRANQLESFHGDPADRLIVSSALTEGATVATADREILMWAESHGEHPQTLIADT